MRSKLLILFCLCVYGLTGMASAGYATLIAQHVAGSSRWFPCQGHHCACATRSRCLAHCCCFPKKSVKAPLSQPVWKACGGMEDEEALAQLRMPECPPAPLIWSFLIEKAPVFAPPMGLPSLRPSEIPTPPPRPLA